MSRMNERPRHLGRASTSLAECMLSEPEETPRYLIVEEDGTYDPDRVPELSDEAFVDFYRWFGTASRRRASLTATVHLV